MGWHEDYKCAHCDKPVTISVSAAWPEQCPHCRVWHPVLRSEPPRHPLSPDSASSAGPESDAA